MDFLEEENQLLHRRIHELEAALQHLQDTHTLMMSENAQLKERVHTLTAGTHTEGKPEERKFARISTNLRIDSVNRRGNAAMGVAKNMSPGGALIETDLSLFPGELITVVFELDSQPFKIPAEVLRTTGNGYGIKFVLAPYQRETLEIYIQRREEPAEL